MLSPARSWQFPPCFFFLNEMSLLLTTLHHGSRYRDAPVSILSSDPARNAERGGDRLASTHAARRNDAARGGGNLCLPAARPACAQESLRDRARGAGSLGCDRIADAQHPARGTLAGERPLRCLRQRDVADPGSARA